MIYDTTHKNPKIKEAINEEVGKSYSFFSRIRMNGIGSQRFIIEGTSVSLTGLLNEVSDLNYANFELRPRGVVVHITKGLKRYSWALPFHKLVLFYTQNFSVHGEGEFIRFRKNKNFNESLGFLRKLLFYKNLFLSQN
jgi:hypothetical protein